MAQSFVGWIVLSLYVVSLVRTSLAYNWMSNNIGEPADIVSFDNENLLVVSKESVISKVSQVTGDPSMF